ncbi:MAG: DUF5103 domain-containing protein [Chryseobacterium sp.]|nr:MAG: DUF5103 domain-containing protein [Chryseobacterium sp.]
MRVLFGFLLLSSLFTAQNIRSVQLFNPKTNDETAVIAAGEQLILSFDDLQNSTRNYRYTIRHLDRNWQHDDLFYTEIANGPMNDLITDYRPSFNTLQSYVHYRLTFPNDKIQPKISGNFELVVYESSPSKPLFTKRFSIYENAAVVAVSVDRTADARRPDVRQRVQVRAQGAGADFTQNLSTLSLSVMQNNNPQILISNIRPSSTVGNSAVFQQTDIAFPGNNEFYYFDNKNLTAPMDMVARIDSDGGAYHTWLHPTWAFPLNYQFNPDVNGAFYFRRNDLGIERNPDTEGDYSWVYFSLESGPVDKEIFVLGQFNDYTPDDESKMHYDDELKMYVAKIYLKQGFYNYLLATRAPGSEKLDYGEINGNFWQTENLYQAFLYYRPQGRNYDALLGYGEFRTPVR